MNGRRRSTPCCCAGPARASRERFGAGRDVASPSRARPRQPDRRAHRLQRRLRAADGDRPRRPCVAFRPRTDRVLRAYSGRPSTRSGRARARRAPSRAGGNGWMRLRRTASPGPSQRGGCRCAASTSSIDGDVPIGAGLSSSAALEIATARALARSRRPAVGPACAWPGSGQKAENNYVGVNCGIMDQFISRPGRRRARAADRLPLARDAAGADPGARRRGGDGHRRAPQAGRQRVQRPAGRLRARRRRDLRGRAATCARCAT